MSYEEFFEVALRRIVWLVLFALLCLGLRERGEGQESWWDGAGNLRVDLLNPYPKVETYDYYFTLSPYQYRIAPPLYNPAYRVHVEAQGLVLYDTLTGCPPAAFGLEGE